MNKPTYSYDIKPFSDFWMNCFLNGMFSLATHFDKAYRLAAYMNHHSFEHTNNYKDPSFRLPAVKLPWFQQMTSAFKFELKPHFFLDEERFVDEIKVLIKEQRIISLCVDLYSWIPGSYCFQRYHWSHYSIIKGYDEARNVFFVLDDNLNGYNEFEISEDTLVTCFKNSDYFMNSEVFKYPYVEMVLDEHVPYVFSFQEVIDHSERLIREIAEFSFDGLWEFDPNSDEVTSHLDYSMIGTESFFNRQIASKYLFQYLVESGHIDNDLYENLVTQVDQIHDGWQIIRNLFGKHKALIFAHRPFTLERDKMIDMAKNLMQKESDMWETLYKANRSLQQVG
ncbi:hypothetical protein GK047_09585 [Paenibacillus sp. SYP-B3998]|uniref:Butirosin biosynthesis protein H N-terminal domain-containing protein n=1 Tax=Paenibacillus sp. SYP-B3998 TaxID=2678564 RepID=A0A6G3ZVV5_9BACL|nr:hypothetical protein [Paenibacillus sp. SYP-B3998]NEW06262.1 hypothetical protein [Paenibacillus sp. SYP-B3998]